MNSFLNSGMFGNIIPPRMQNMMNVIQQAQQIRQHPEKLASLLQQRGFVTPEQASQIKDMGNNYEQIGQYLMQNGKMPTNLRPYEEQVNQAQSMMPR